MLKMDRYPFLLLMSLTFLAPGLTDAAIKSPLNTDTNTFAANNLDLSATKLKNDMERVLKMVDVMVAGRRMDICCQEALDEEDKLALALRSAVQTSVISLNRLLLANNEFRANMEHRMKPCQPCNIPPAMTACNYTDWRCGTGECVEYQAICDLNDDCYDKSDESDAACETPHPCGVDKFLCVESRVCIHSSYTCDNHKDCPDGSDEEGCEPVPLPETTPAPTTPKTPSPCEEHDFHCVSSGECVDSVWRCDGGADCEDGSDEADCDKHTCGMHEFQCVSNGVCVPVEGRCDGYGDCDDDSDEANCGKHTCAPGHFKCVKEERCIDEGWQCDGLKDCDDGSDEADCTTTPPPTCGKNQFQCVSNGECVPGDWRCDSEGDCDDYSDEANCDKHACDEGEFQCVTSKACIKGGWRCDGEKDCGDGSDEADCKPTSPSPTCSQDNFKCVSDGKCLPKLWRCDGEVDCDDGSDEAQCDDDNNIQDVKDACKGSSCSHGCVEALWHPSGYHCTCPSGMKLQAHDRYTCTETSRKGVKG